MSNLETDLDAQHAKLMGSVVRYSGKATALVIASGVIQEGLALNQALAEHCRALKKELDELRKKVPVN